LLFRACLCVPVPAPRAACTPHARRARRQVRRHVRGLAGAHPQRGEADCGAARGAQDGCRQRDGDVGQGRAEGARSWRASWASRAHWRSEKGAARARAALGGVGGACAQVQTAARVASWLRAGAGGERCVRCVGALGGRGRSGAAAARCSRACRAAGAAPACRRAARTRHRTHARTLSANPATLKRTHTCTRTQPTRTAPAQRILSPPSRTTQRR
jgi:hypothetical protein